MPVRIAEYLGQRVDVDSPDIIPSRLGGGSVPTCPFLGAPCTKMAGRKKYHPVCCVRRDDTVFPVCPYRLIPSKARLLTPGHIALLADLAKTLFPGANNRDIGFQRQKGLRFGSRGMIFLDYVLSLRAQLPSVRSWAIVEVQGGGETSNTGTVTRAVNDWIDADPGTNDHLRQALSRVGIIPNNAWKRQLEQVFRKGPLAIQHGGGLCLAVGTVLYDYIDAMMPNLGSAYSPDWEVAIVELAEVRVPYPGAIPFGVGRSQFFSYSNFVERVTRMPASKVNPSLGRFETIDNNSFIRS